MSDRSRRLVTAVAVALCATLAAAVPAPGQTRPSPSGSGGWTAPRTPWGDPDFQGTWTTDETIGVPIQRPPALGNKLYLTDEDLAQQAKERAARAAAPAAAGGASVNPPDHWGESASAPVRQTSFVVAPADGRIPAVTPEGQKRAGGRDTGSFGAGPFNRPEDFTNFDRCISRGVVGSMLPRPYGNGLDIVQAPGYVAIRYEMIHEPRIIPLGNQPRLGASIKQYMGDARGRWDGATLVVETTNITDQMSIGFNGNGLRHSDQMRLVERFTRVNPTTIEWEVTIEDPKTYTKPFKMALPIVSRPGYQVFEYACHEGNYGLPNILSGARATERAETASPPPASPR
ncbi:MAG TPA: hypothetical protein VFD69_19980 [Vicinamibacterales bacterium]|nr:hypothetical protein [Vicinamibacterales bacterium]